MSSSCSVCEGVGCDGGLLNCQHGFCTNCYSRYIDGSLRELNNFLRCCICGEVTSLTYETKSETLLNRFGRDQHVQLLDPKGLFVTKLGHFIFSDNQQHRIIIYDKKGQPFKDFATLFKNEILHGITVIEEENLIIVPFKDENYTSLALYRLDGGLRGCTYLKPDSQVGGLACDDMANLYVTDPVHSCVYVINKSRTLTHSIQLHQLPDEFETPIPHAISLNPTGQLVISDLANNRIKIYDTKGSLVSCFGSTGERPGQFRNPTGIAVDADGRMIITEKDNHRVQLFTARGVFIRFIVRYNRGPDVYMAPIDAHVINSNTQVAILLSGTRHSLAGEVRMYSIL